MRAAEALASLRISIKTCIWKGTMMLRMVIFGLSEAEI